MSAITVLLVDDHLMVRSGLKALLGTQPDIAVVAEAATGEEALLAVGQRSPAVVMMDLAMGYLLKDPTPDEIFAAVRGFVQGKSVHLRGHRQDPSGAHLRQAGRRDLCRGDCQSHPSGR
jgi:hypothetical protein